MTVIDEYLEKVSLPQRAELARVRQIVKQVVPDAEETISYGMPTLKYNNQYLIYFAAFKDHMSIFPGTIRFTADNPVPESTIKAIVINRLAIISKD
jgi:uncharacterized protein YdhG (YjbR/CyaY superfamily)